MRAMVALHGLAVAADAGGFARPAGPLFRPALAAVIGDIEGDIAPAAVAAPSGEGPA